MDDSIDSYSQSESPPPQSQPQPRLTLVLPPLRDLKKSTKKSSKSKHSKSKQPFAYAEYQDASTSQKTPRPVKLKPLKEVLSRLVLQLKKKDDYAFFLTPVNPAKVPGYADLVKRPMDLGTMTTKVQRGRYRSLEDFANDFRLVTSNAKIFNPPGSIYHTEADRLEVWGLEQISKAAATVIQYETDWNIEIEKDDYPEEEGEDFSMGVAGAGEDAEERSRSPSVSLHGGGHPAALRRGPRGPYNKAGKEKENPGTGPGGESIDAEGRLPGSKDGLGAFPPGSDWARTMLALKLKGKRYKTKKERLRIEKDGPPYLPDGSLDYNEVEDPFSFLSALVPDPLTRPHLAPIYPPLPTAHPPRLPSATPAPSAQSYPLPTLFPTPHPAPPAPPPARPLKHYTLLRSGAARRPKDDVPPPPAGDEAEDPAREAHALDFGSFAVLAGELAEELRRRGGALPEALEDADALVKADVRASVEVPSTVDDGDAEGDAGEACEASEYWSTTRALAAEGYIRDVVYGGVDGLAYVRSLAEFVGTAPRDVGPRAEREHDGDGDIDMDVDMEEEGSPRFPLGAPLAAWVAQNVVGPLTEGRHALLQRTARELVAPTPAPPAKRPTEIETKPEPEDDAALPPVDDKLPALVAASLHVRPRAAAALAALLQIRAHKIDMAALIRTPAELAQSEAEWAGAALGLAAGASAGPKEMGVVLEYVAGRICRLAAERVAGVKREADGEGEAVDETGESAVVRNLRLNLLALVKRAPLDTIARLPVDLVPEHIRAFVPTLTAVAPP